MRAEEPGALLGFGDGRARGLLAQLLGLGQEEEPQPSRVLDITETTPLREETKQNTHMCITPLLRLKSSKMDMLIFHHSQSTTQSTTFSPTISHKPATVNVVYMDLEGYGVEPKTDHKGTYG